MKKLLLASLFLVLVVSISAQTNIFYFDFGRHDNTNGHATTNPDTNGNYWNNVGTVTSGYSLPNLINSINTTSAYSLAVTGAGFDFNGILNGGLRTPYASQFSGNEDFTISSVTEDYFFTTLTSNGPSVEFSGLNSLKKYRFKIFGCRNTNSLRTSQYTLQGAGSAVTGTLNTSSVTGLGGPVYISSTVTYPATFNIDYKLASEIGFTQAVTFYGNNSSVYYSDYVLPDANNKIKLSLTVVTGGFAYINAIKMEEYDVSTNNITPSENVNFKINKTQGKVMIDGTCSKVDIYDVSGVRVVTYNKMNDSEIDISKLNKGIYVLVIDGKNRFKFSY
jgi:hypothetical protein